MGDGQTLEMMNKFRVAHVAEIRGYIRVFQQKEAQSEDITARIVSFCAERCLLTEGEIAQVISKTLQSPREAGDKRFLQSLLEEKALGNQSAMSL